jgi:hypothetical protein
MGDGDGRAEALGHEPDERVDHDGRPGDHERRPHPSTIPEKYPGPTFIDLYRESKRTVTAEESPQITT